MEPSIMVRGTETERRLGFIWGTIEARRPLRDGGAQWLNQIGAADGGLCASRPMGVALEVPPAQRRSALVRPAGPAAGAATLRRRTTSFPASGYEAMRLRSDEVTKR